MSYSKTFRTTTERVIHCDSSWCLEMAGEFDTPWKETKRIAKEAGWTFKGKESFCPKCSTKALEGNTNADD